MKKKILLISIIAVVLLVLILFTPIPQGSYDDGGTREYNALTYKIVAWNRISVIIDENGQAVPDTYKKTSVYWFPENFKNIDELWEMEIGEEQNDKQPESAPLLKSRGAKSVSVTSLPEGYDYYYEGNDAKLIEDYLFDLNLISDFEENPDEYSGMTWVISLEYENGEERTVYHFGNMFIRSENEPWYRMTYEEAHRFDALLIELNSNDDSAVECKYLTEKDGVYTLTLPQSGEVIELRNEQADFVPYITYNLVEAAERKITEDVSDYSRHSDFYLQITDGYLCLVSEVIKNIDPPVTSDGYEIGGCGYDHEHLFFSERISDRALE